jgi:hypothetical protein
MGSRGVLAVAKSTSKAQGLDDDKTYYNEVPCVSNRTC